MRIYDPRVGRFLSVDPLTKNYPMLTPYQFASNTPIQAIDIDGLEKYHYLLTQNDQGKPKLLFLRTEHFTETSKEWDPTWKNPLNTKKTTVTDPRTQFIVHGQVEFSLGLDGDIDQTEDVTWTFSSHEEMKTAEANGGPGNLKHWDWINSDQQVKISTTIAIYNSWQAEGETGGFRGLWRGLRYNFSVGASFGSRHMAKSITSKSFAKEMNTVGLKNVNFKSDLEAINYGAAKEVSDKTHGTIYELKNGNRYYNDNGVLKPLQGGGYVNLTRSQFKALGLLNMTNGDINSNVIQKPLGKQFSSADLKIALDVYNKSR